MEDIKKLKQSIEDKTIDNTFKLFLCSDQSSYIIAEQYYNYIANIFNLSIKNIESINDIPDNSFVEDNNLYILKVDEWNIKDSYNNCIVICNKTKDNRAIKLPKLEDWQVVDYCASKVKGINIDSLTNLIKCYNGNYYKFINDINKLSIFNENVQYVLLQQFITDGLIDNYHCYKIWDLSTAIIKKDLVAIKSILEEIETIDVEPLGLAKILYTNFKNIVSIQTNNNITASDLGISDKQFYVIKKFNCGYYSNNSLIKILKLLTNIEYLFKYDELPINNLIDYIIVNIIRED